MLPKTALNPPSQAAASVLKEAAERLTVDGAAGLSAPVGNEVMRYHIQIH